ncbi:hypothetical protein V5P93_006298 [Actinokineospora auranticolor]|uniref:Uncharacterized protein n=1 Tax=Actinokineospora auranticolor TaxID=155976 RepID=A0A2S6GIA7_9PSEU|nr:hypothetical protein [Actinokineospora auranticolor]PPK64896.1 hypothetical protein CLV40_117135 [Actinokineospora auranticolor]
MFIAMVGVVVAVVLLWHLFAVVARRTGEVARPWGIRAKATLIGATAVCAFSALKVFGSGTDYRCLYPDPSHGPTYLPQRWPCGEIFEQVPGFINTLFFVLLAAFAAWVVIATPGRAQDSDDERD